MSRMSSLNYISKASLEHTLHQHMLWLDDPTCGKPADLSGTNLFGSDFRSKKMRNIVMRGANLQGANLEGADRDQMVRNRK